MTEALRLHGLGAVVEVRCTGSAVSELATAMRAAWSRCLQAHDPSAPPIVAKPFAVQLDDPTQLAKELMLTTRRVTRALITARAGHLLMLHAGAMSDPTTGRSLVYVAAGGTGKTTMSRLLGQRLGYLTDETVGIDETGRILPYPKPLSVRRANERAIKDELSPDALGLIEAPPLAQVSRLILLDRQPHGGGDLAEVGFMDALLALVEQSSSLPALPKALHRLADVIDGTGPVLRLRYSEATHLEDTLTALVEGP